MDWLTQNWGTLAWVLGLAAGLAGLAAGIECLVMRKQIYKHQRREAKMVAVQLMWDSDVAGEMDSQN